MHHHYIDRFAYQDSPIHRLDPRSKTLAVLAFSLTLITLPKHTLPSSWYAVFPAVLIFWGQMPLRFVAKHTLVVSPFILFVVIFAPFYDTTPMTQHGLTLSGGWWTAASLLFRFVLGMAALIALAGTTRFASLLHGLERLGVPLLLVTQLRFLYRYLFLLIDQSMHLRQARRARDAGRGPLSSRWQSSAGLVGVLFTRTLDQAERAHLAMIARGYEGSIRLLRPLCWRSYDTGFVMAVGVYLVLVRLSQ